MRMTRDQYPVLPGVDPDEATDWDRFVIDHRCLLNLRLHVFSAFLFWFTLIASVLTFSGWWFLAFCLSASPAALAHRVSGEGNPQLERGCGQFLAGLFFFAKLHASQKTGVEMDIGDTNSPGFKLFSVQSIRLR